MPQSHLCFQFRSSVVQDPNAWNPVNLSFFFFFLHILHQVYLCLWTITENYICFWMGWLMVCCTVLSGGKQNIFSMMSCVYDSRTSTTHPCAASAWPWGEHQLKTATFDHCVDCFLLTKDWSISRYTGSVGDFVFSWEILCLSFLMGVVKHTFLSDVFDFALTFKHNIGCITLFICRCSWLMQTFGYFLMKLKMFW